MKQYNNKKEIDEYSDNYKSHMALSKSISDFGSDLKKVVIEIQTVKNEAIQHTSEHEVINLKLDNLDKKLESFVTKDQFWPVKTLVYSAVGIILTTVILGGLGLIISERTSPAHATVITK